MSWIFVADDGERVHYDVPPQVAQLEAKLERLEDIRRAAHNYINVRGVNNVKAANELRDALAALEGEQDG